MERVFVDVEDARTIGWRLRHVRDDRGKSLRVVAGLAGMEQVDLEPYRARCAFPDAH
ncbi:MAG: hypothetical protein ACRDQ4_16840 [Pseudonocardiaceae bacterium]